jgi:hypothetical protein
MPDTALPTTRVELIAAVRAARFSHARFKAGYDEIETDALLDDVVASLQQPPQALPYTGGRLLAAPLRVSRLRGGYSIPDVDAFLARLAAALDRLAP